MKTNRNFPFVLLSAVVGIVVAVAGALSALDSARLVDVIGIFAGAFGAGAALVFAVVSRHSGPTPETEQGE